MISTEKWVPWKSSCSLEQRRGGSRGQGKWLQGRSRQGWLSTSQEDPTCCSISHLLSGRPGGTSRHTNDQSKNRRFISRALFHLDSLLHRNARSVKLAAALGCVELTIPEDLRGRVCLGDKRNGRRWKGGGVTSWSVGKEKESPGLWAWHLSWALNSLEKNL